VSKGEEDGRGAYVRRVAQETHRYAEEMLAENHNLRLQVAAFEAERERLAERLRSTEAVIQQNEFLKERAQALEHEKSAMEERLLEACLVIERRQEEQQQLEERVLRVKAESDRFAEQYRDLEAQNTNLANLYVASYQIHGTLDRNEVFSIIQQIVANLVGCEELGIFEWDPSGAALSLSASTGIERAPYETIPAGQGVIGRSVETGETWIVGEDAPERARSTEEAALSACIPLKLDGRVSGALALFRLLPQKSGIEALDRELFELLATHAATAIHCATLHARVKGEVPS
jgi:putative methionine-R-sulfoxide reductase with GAF domain